MVIDRLHWHPTFLKVNEMKYPAASTPPIGLLAATAISSTAAELANLLVSTSELTSLFVPTELQPLWTRSARLTSSTIEILPFVAAAALRDITLGVWKGMANKPVRENLGARRRREEHGVPAATHPGEMDEA